MSTYGINSTIGVATPTALATLTNTPDNVQNVTNAGQMNRTMEVYSLDEFSVERIIYIIITVLFTIYSLVAFGYLYHFRNWYIIRQRNFKLTMFGGIASFLNGFNNLITQCMKTSCGVSMYFTNIIGPLSQLIFLSRAVRLVMLYKLNIYKVTSLKKRRLATNYSEQEPNQYMAKIYQKVDKIIIGLIIIPTAICTAFAIYIQVGSEMCKIFELSNASEVLGKVSKDDMVLGTPKEFVIMQIFGTSFLVVNIILFFFLKNVKDSHKFGLKFDCASTAIVCIISQTLAIACNAIQGQPNVSPKVKHFLGIFKQGKIFFVFVAFYIILASIVLPIYLCYRSSYEKNKYFNEPTSSIQYFYKVLNSPSLIEELKSISIKEFSVENILFWENYQILQKMVYRYQIEYRRAERVGNPMLLEQYNFEAYYQSQLQTSHSTSSMEDYSYEPDMMVPEKLMPYYISFYHTFIDISGPASVNISGRISRQIYNEFCTYPTIGIFDEAKNEIVEVMYTSIFPILLRQNRQSFGKN